jgi:hypothetical protein
VNVYVYPSDLQGCGYYRLIWASIVLRGEGHNVKIVSPKYTQRVTGVPDGQGNLVSINAPKDADVMVFQRVASKMMLQAVSIWRANGIAVVMDIDDDMSAIDQANPAWLALHPNSGGRTEEYDWNVARKVCDAASFVTVSSEALLKRYALHGRGVVLHNVIPKAALDIVRTEQSDTIGWGGNLRSHPDDPQVVGTSMTRIQREGHKFTIVGPGRGMKDAFRLDEEPIITGPIPIHRWVHELAKLSVGIAPLNDTRFNQAKSWLKMLEYAAVGTPCIASPRAEYRRLHARGVGLLAESPRDWYRHAQRLLTDEAYRTDVGSKARAAVADLTVEGNAWRWWEAWSRALAVERGPLATTRAAKTNDTGTT